MVDEKVSITMEIFLTDYLPICILIVLSSLMLNGFRALINDALPGDKEMLAILKHVRTRKAHTHQQSCQIIHDLAKLAFQEGQINPGNGNVEDDSVGIMSDTRPSTLAT